MATEVSPEELTVEANSFSWKSTIWPRLYIASFRQSLQRFTNTLELNSCARASSCLIDISRWMNAEVRRIGLAQYLQVTPRKTIGTWATFMVNSKTRLTEGDKRISD